MRPEQSRLPALRLPYAKAVLLPLLLHESCKAMQRTGGGAEDEMAHDSAEHRQQSCQPDCSLASLGAVCSAPLSPAMFVPSC